MTKSDWFPFYYAHPQPERFVDEVRELARGPLLDDSATRIVVATFLSRILAAHPDRVRAWMEQLLDVEGTYVRQTIDLAAWLSNATDARAYLVSTGSNPEMAGAPPDLLAWPIDHPSVLDMLWAYYFATGSSQAVRRVVSALAHLPDIGAALHGRSTAHTEEDRVRALNAAIYRAAMRSLATLMKQHAPLQAMCERLIEAGDLSPNERCGLALTLQDVDPSKWTVHVDEGTFRVMVVRKCAVAAQHGARRGTRFCSQAREQGRTQPRAFG